jgi:type IX secretion system PorP/SprF family membrane protein
MALLAVKANAQQDGLYTQYMNQLLSMNPAYAGAKGVTSATIMAREQWVSFPGHPGTQNIFVHSPLNEQTGVGGSIENDSYGIVNTTRIFGDYSFSINYPGDKYLSLGLKAGVSFYYAQLTTVDLGALNNPVDPAFSSDIGRNFMPNFGVGVYYSTPDYYLGFSVPKLLSTRLYETGFEVNAVAREQMHMFFMGGYVYDLSRIIKFKPYFMLRGAPNAPLSLDVTAQFVVIDRLWLGVTYRLMNHFGFLAQVKVNEQLTVGYAYDLTTTEIRQYSNGTHEILIGFDFSFGRGRVRSPRYF